MPPFVRHVREDALLPVFEGDEGDPVPVVELFLPAVVKAQERDGRVGQKCLL